MIRSAWKPAEEIRYTLRGKDSVTILACGTCANLSGTGGHRGLKFLRGLVESWGIEVVAARCVATCCPEETMKQVLKRYDRYIKRSDALVMLSCSGGVKAAFLCDPGLPVIAALDTVGSVPVSRSDDPVALSTCSYCEHCVISFTGGICPSGKCPAGRLYEPCSQYPTEDGRCAVDPDIDCIWVEIEKRGDLSALKELGRIQESLDVERIQLPPPRSSPAFIRKLAGWFVSRIRGWSRLVRLID